MHNHKNKNPNNNNKIQHSSNIKTITATLTHDLVQLIMNITIRNGIAKSLTQ